MSARKELKRPRSQVVCVVGLLVLALGCADIGAEAGGGNGGDGGRDGTGGTVGGGGVGGVVCDASEPVSFFLDAYIFAPGEPNVPLEDVTLCELDNGDNCEPTDANGKAILELPACSEIAFTAEKEGYRSWIYANVTDETLTVDGGIPMHTHELTAAMTDQLQTPYPWVGGAVALISGSRSGLMFAPAVASVEEVGELSYFDGTEYDPMLDATGSVFGPWDYPLGAGGFVDVTPGVQEFEFGGSAGQCPSVSWGWPASGPNSVRLPIRDGFTTYGSMNCDGL